jgi:peptide/nickel transport system ATP-binding protein
MSETQEKPRENALCVEDLRVSVGHSNAEILQGISFTIAPGEVLALVGESGSGKTTAGLAVLGHFRTGTVVSGGRVVVAHGGETSDVLALPGPELRRLRGATVSYVPQDPSASLNPALRIGTQIREVLDTHGFGDSAADRQARALEVLEEVGLPGTDEYLRRYPHQLSGGQQQRVGIAMAFACCPDVMVLDEPTTGLDVTTQTRVLDTVRRLTRDHDLAALYITHDLAVVGEIADRVAVMYSGNLVEVGPAEALLHAPAHPYTERLVQAAPDLAGRRVLRGLSGYAPAPSKRPDGCHFAPRCPYALEECQATEPVLEPVADLELHQVSCLRHAELRTRTPEVAERAEVPEPETGAALTITGLDVKFGRNQVLSGVDLELRKGECVILLGESGSGKTTLSRCVAGLNDRYDGTIALAGTALARDARGRSVDQRRSIQYVFQSPYSSLNPRQTVAESMAMPLRALTDMPRKEHVERVAEMLERVHLRAGLADRFPDQLSGGERQRVAIGRALMTRPEVLVCDEVTSALDVSVQASIVELLRDLQREMGLTLLFVTHNIALVRHVAQRVAILQGGRIVELAAADKIIDEPSDDYTRELIANTPSL